MFVYLDTKVHHVIHVTKVTTWREILVEVHNIIQDRFLENNNQSCSFHYF